jgi:hypothetical protein
MESTSISTTVQQQQPKPQLSSFNKRCYKPKPKYRRSLNHRYINQHLFKDYLLQPRSLLKYKPNPKVQYPVDSSIPEIVDIRQVKVVLHKLQLYHLPIALPTSTPTTTVRDASTQTTDPFVRPSQDSSTQTIDPFGLPNLTSSPVSPVGSVPDQDRRFINSSFSEDELEAIKQFIVETDPNRHDSSSHSSSSSSSNYTIEHLSLNPISSSDNSSHHSNRTICISSSSNSSDDIVSWIPVRRKRLSSHQNESSAHLRSLRDWLRGSSP